MNDDGEASRLENVVRWMTLVPPPPATAARYCGIVRPTLSRVSLFCSRYIRNFENRM